MKEPKPLLSGFEQLAGNIPEEEWMSTPKLVGYVKTNFESRYCPESMISALGLRFSDPELNVGFQKPTALVPYTSVNELVSAEAA